MKKASLIMRKLWLGKSFVTASDLKILCKEIDANYKDIVRYLLARKYLVRIFKGIFYVKSLEEIKFGKINLSRFELVANGIKLKGVDNWYFGLYTALKLNNLTHEFFTVDYVINDKVFRAKEIKIADNEFKFIKIKTSLFFGIKEKKGIKYSNMEKTILDFIYLYKYRGVPTEKILLDVSELIEKASKNKLLKYGRKYPKSVRKIVKMIK